MNKKATKKISLKKSNLKCYTVTHNTMDTHTRVVADAFDISTFMMTFFQDGKPVAMFSNVLYVTTPDAVILGDKK